MTSLQLQNDLLTIAEQFGVTIQPLQGLLGCAFVGEWNHGKSELINSLLGLPLLPASPIPTTKTVVRLSRSPDSDPQAKLNTTDGIMTYRGTEAIDALQNARENLLSIDYKAPNLDLPSNVQFIDTPGINDTDQIASSRAESVAADIVVFVLKPNIAAVNQTQIDFIQKVILGKSNADDLFFVFTHNDQIESEQDRIDLQKRVGMHIGSDRVFFVSNTQKSGIQEFKQALYDYLVERQTTLLADRRERHLKQLNEALDKKLKLERLALQQYKHQTTEQRERFLADIQIKRREETNKKNAIRKRSEQRLEETLQFIKDRLEEHREYLDTFIEASTASQLQQKDYLQQKIQDILEKQLQPTIEDKLKGLLESIQGDIDEGQHHSADLLADLDMHLPTYYSPVGKVTAEHIMPIAVIGSVALFGWLSVPTLLLGFLTIKAKELGLIRYAEHTGLLDSALDKLKDIAATGYKRAVKQAVAQTLHNYRNHINDHFRDVLENITEQAVAKVNYVEEMEKTLYKLRDEGGRTLIEREISLDKAEALLLSIQSQNNFGITEHS